MVGPRRQGAATEEAAGALALLPTAAAGRLVLFLVGGGRWVVGIHPIRLVCPAGLAVQYHVYGQNFGI